MWEAIDHNDPSTILAESDDAQEAGRLLAEFDAEEIELLRRHLASGVMVAWQEMRLRLMDWTYQMLHYIGAPNCNVSRFWGVVYALDLGLHKETSPAEMARRYGITRASISHAMREFAILHNLEPSRWMRSEETVGANRKARMGKLNDELSDRHD